MPVAPSREWVEELRATLPEPPRERRARLQAEWGFTDLEMRDTVGAGALDAGRGDRRRRRHPAGRPQVVARRAGPPGQRARASTSPSCRSPRPHVAGSQALVDDGQVNDKLARQVFEGVLAGEGTPDEVVAARGLAVVSDEGALARPSTRRSPPTPTSPTRSATARSPPPARSSAR